MTGVRTETAGAVLVVTIDRPDARNAIDLSAAEAIAAAMTELDSRTDLSAAVLTGAGGTFSAGMDLKAFLAGERPIVPHRGFAGIVEAPPEKPIIAAVEGYALAGGFEIALACDLLVASRTAVFGLPEVKRGLVAAGGGLLRLPHRVPHALALEWALTGAHIPAERAADAGLVNRLTEPGHAMATALELARTIAANAPLAVRATKHIMTRARDWPAAEAFPRSREIAVPVRESRDAQEGSRAFAEKREPVWEGR
ncbi:crotonase/enoyl-CoA hydratase family protein [Amycolatopsis silviterrae]|uniref:Crotonase/enoyl-CoA hydratase family protein n=1 Tax=Amycolatopsis silviterrae TaxID=1656914 RepID=A0ABW5HFU5_9PSEU